MRPGTDWLFLNRDKKWIPENIQKIRTPKIPTPENMSKT